MTTLQLGRLLLPSRVLLSPMESVSDAGFRRLCFENGAAITWTEMIRARGVLKNNKSTLDLIDSHDPATLTGIQLMVGNERELLACLQRLEALAATTHPHFRNLRAVDLNFGCPSPDVVRIGAGPALLKRRGKLRAIFEALAAWKKGTALDVGAVGAKIRLGLTAQEQEHKVYLPIIEVANDTLDYLVVHARHAKQRSRDKPTWSAIGEVKAQAKIPVIGNGDVVTAADAARMFEQTGCDGIMVARGAIANPWCFRWLDGQGGDGRFTPDDVAAAAARYGADAAAFATKEKFREYHRDNFARLAGGTAPRVVPKNAHID